MKTARAVADFVLRLAFFVGAPIAIVKAAALFPVGGAIVQIVIALVIFFVGEAARGLSEKYTLARRLLRKQLEFEAYYREHPPRPFLYYVFYPLLFPYWLWNREARRELMLFRGFTILSAIVLVGTLTYQFFRLFPPELGAKEFFPLAAGTIGVETLVILAFLMPMATTVVHFHRERAPIRLAVLLLAALVSIGVTTYRVTKKRDPLISYATKQRARARSAVSPRGARAAQERALRVAWKVLPHSADDVDIDGKVEGLPLEMARIALTPFYKPDEAAAWDLWYTKAKIDGKSQQLLVLYFAATRGKNAMWIAIDRSEKITNDPLRLPSGAFKAMWKAAAN